MVLIVDIHTPEDLKHFCRDFPPIIKNTNISREDIGVYMQKVAEQHDSLKKPKKYLISSSFGKEILINMEMAELYLNLGLKIIRIYEFIQFHPEKCFETLANKIVNSRREADLDKSKTVIALTNKLTGNSLYSASLLNKEKHRNITYHSKDTIIKSINDPHFVHLDEIISDVCEVKSLKRNIRHDLPMQIGLNVYLNSKLHMLKFFYCFLKKYVPERCFELLESDTDSMYFAISRRSLDDCVPEDVKEEYFRARLCWLPAEACPQRTESYIKQRTTGDDWEKQECCQKYNKFTQRTLGLMKVEYFGNKQISLKSKTYFCLGDKSKQVSKRVCINQNPLTFEEYRNVLQSNQPLTITNHGFCSYQNRIFSYAQFKKRS